MNSMDDKRTNLALFLILIIVMMYTQLVLTPEQPVQQPAAAPSLQQAAPSPGAVTQPAAPMPATAEITQPSAADISAAPVTIIETNTAVWTVNHLGARLQSLMLQKYREHLGEETLLNLVSTAEGAALPLGVQIEKWSDVMTNYRLTSATEGVHRDDNRFVLQAGQTLRLVFEGEIAGKKISKALTFRPDSYLLAVDVKLDEPMAGAPAAWLEWTHFLASPENQDSLNPKHFTILTERNKIVHVEASKTPTVPATVEPVVWSSFDDKYFTAALIPAVKDANSVQFRSGNLFVQRVKGAETASSFQIYAGPKDYEILDAAGYDLRRSIDLGFFSFLAYPLLLALKAFHSLLSNWGLAIVLLTLAVKALLFPLNQASFRSMKEMQKLQPEMQALRERIKDPNKLNQEVMNLYKKHNVNPMGGCLPVLLQIPVFFGLYSALQNAIELRHAPWALWVNDLSAPEQLHLFGIRFPIMIIIMGAAMLIQQYLTPTPGQDPTQRRTMLIMSVVFTISFIIFPFPAGLALYMLINTLISIVQQMYLRSEADASPFKGTMLASIAIFFVAWVATRL